MFFDFKQEEEYYPLPEEADEYYPLTQQDVVETETESEPESHFDSSDESPYPILSTCERILFTSHFLMFLYKNPENIFFSMKGYIALKTELKNFTDIFDEPFEEKVTLSFFFGHLLQDSICPVSLEQYNNSFIEWKNGPEACSLGLGLWNELFM